MFNKIYARYRISMLHTGSFSTPQGVQMNLTAQMQRICFQSIDRVWLDSLSQKDYPNHEYQPGTLS